MFKSKKVNYKIIKNILILSCCSFMLFGILQFNYSLGYTAVVDETTAIRTGQDLVAQNFYGVLLRAKENNSWDSLCSSLLTSTANGQCYFDITYKGIIRVYYYDSLPSDAPRSQKGAWVVGTSTFISTAWVFSLTNVPYYEVVDGAIVYRGTTDLDLPQECVGYVPKLAVEMYDYFIKQTTSLGDIYNSIYNNTTRIIQFLKENNIKVNVDLSNLFLVLNNNAKQAHEDSSKISNSIDETNKFLKDTNTSDSDYEFSSNNGTNDVTSDGLNSIFTTFYNCFANAEEKDIVFPLPFVKQSITIPSKFLENTLKAHGFKFVVDLARTVWFFAVSCFIIKDVSNYVDKLKTGEILSKSDTNIKTDIL